MASEEKYVVFKKEDFDNWADGTRGYHEDDLLRHVLDHSVVIRLQDVFAPSALHAYASSIQTAIEIVDNIVHLADGEDVITRMSSIRDYFFEQAQKSEHMKRKVPD